MKKELLSPAGNMECLKAAVHAGSDAIYIGGKKFGARKFASNFNDEEIIEAINYCHLYNVKLYVTVNTMIYEDEIDEVINYVRFLHQNNIDAIIIQDIGLIKIIHDKFPNLELHASTQLHNYTKQNIEELKQLGITRVVLARELTIDEINNIKTDIEKEIFIHGAICISYSGQCLFSSLILNRSGNRGECAGMCRLPYKLESNGKVLDTKGEYILSPKELSTLDRFKELMESDVTCFKIEGRMKSPNYVYLITKLYRTLIDKYYNNEELRLTDQDIKNITVTYNRNFTNGHLFNETNDNLMNIETPNHIGIPLGKIIDINKNKIYIKLEEDLNQEDGIRFKTSNKGGIINFLYNEKGLLTNSIKKGNIAIIDNKYNIKEKEEVLKTIDKKLNDELDKYELKKIDVNIICKIHENKEMFFKINDNKSEVIINGTIPQKSINKPTTEEDIKEHLTKLGNTIYKCKKIDIEIDSNLFIPLKEINNIKRELIDKLTELRLKRNKEFIENITEYKYEEISNTNTKLSCLVRNKEQLEKCIELNVDRIYITDEKLYNEYKNKCNLYLRLERIKKYKEFNNEKLLITEIAKFNYLKNNECITDYYLNVANSQFCEYLKDKNVKTITLSVENKDTKLLEFINKYNRYFNIEVLVYGRIELMIMKHCIMSNINNKDKCMDCNLCQNKNYLIDRNNMKYPVIANKDKINHILNYTSKIMEDDYVKELINNKISWIRLEFFDEDKYMLENIIKKYQDMLQK